FLGQILGGDHPGQTAVLVHHASELFISFTQLVQDRRKRQGHRNHHGGTGHFADVYPRQVPISQCEHITQTDHTHDVVHTVTEHGETGVGRSNQYHDPDDRFPLLHYGDHLTREHSVPDIAFRTLS